MFKVKLIDLGSVRERSSTNFSFKNSDYKGNIIRATPSCGCTKVTVQPSGDITGTFRSDSVPHHLKHVGYYTTSKYITVLYNDGSSEVLTIKAKVHE